MVDLRIINTERTVYGLLVHNVFNRIRLCYVRDRRTKQTKYEVTFSVRGRGSKHIIIFTNPLYLDRDTEEFCYAAYGREFTKGEVVPIYSKTYMDALLSGSAQ